jgi:hypothetical protein
MTFNSDKTESMLFSNTDIPEFNFTFNERTIPITNSHKHLGVTFSSDAKWNIHILNNRGPSTDPWGTPAETLQSEEDDLFINTLCCRSCR